MATPPSRGRDDESRRQPLELCEDDRRKLWALLDADMPARQRRLELGQVALFVLSGSQVAALLGGPNPITAVWHLLF